MRLVTPVAARSSWPTAPARSLFSREQRPVRPDDGVVTAFRDGQVTLRSNRRQEGFTNAIEEIGYQGVRSGDLVIHSMDGFAGAIGVSESDGKASPVVHCYRPSSSVDGRYYAYLLRDLAVHGYITSLAKGIRERSTAFDMETFRSLVLPVPPFPEQRAIADYLDTETARIDALIAKKQRMIELLDERRSAFVGRAVTLGVNDARETPTDNEFAPVVRAGWTLHRLRHVVEEIVDTAHKTAPVVDDGEYLVVRTTNVKSGTLVLDGARYTDEAAWREWTARGVPSAGDVIFTREAPAGEACLVPEGTALCIGQRTVLLRPNRSMIDGEWIVHSIYSGAAQRFIEVLAKSTTVAHINMSDIPDLPVVVPPLQEQKSVLATVRREVSRLAGLKEKLGRQIDLLRERRQALITAAVTGELEITGVAA
jgi:type I restriction enzyme S subunit